MPKSFLKGKFLILKSNILGIAYCLTCQIEITFAFAALDDDHDPFLHFNLVNTVKS